MFEQIIGNFELFAGDVILNFFAEVVEFDGRLFDTNPFLPGTWDVNRFHKTSSLKEISEVTLKTFNRLKIWAEPSKGPGILC